MSVCRICSSGPSRATSFRAGGRWGEGICSEQLGVVSSRHCDGMGKGNCSRDARSQIRRRRCFTVGGRDGRSWRHIVPEVAWLLPSRHVRQVQTLRITTGPRADTLERWVSSGALVAELATQPWAVSHSSSSSCLACRRSLQGLSRDKIAAKTPPIGVVLLGTQPRLAICE